MDPKVLQRIVDNQRQARERNRRACTGRCVSAADDGVTHTAGARLVDSVTGQIVEVISARQLADVDPAS